MTAGKNHKELDVIRRSAAELLAYVVVDLFPQAKPLEGDLTDIGFYYDFIVPQNIEEGFLPLLEERLRALIKENLPVKTMEMMRGNAVDFFLHHKQDLKAELLKKVQDEVVQLFKLGEFHDLCPITPVTSTGAVGAIKLLKVGPALSQLPKGEVAVTRIEGTAFPDQSSLKTFLKRFEEAKKRDHRLLGQELELFETNEETGPGFWVWYPRGAILKEIVIDWWKAEMKKLHFQPLSTPSFVKASLLHKAGFFNSASQNTPSFPNISLAEGEYTPTPILTPWHCLVYKAKNRFYPELPIRFNECVNCTCDIKISQARGLINTRVQLRDCATIFCNSSQVEKELISSLQFIDRTIRIFGLKYRIYLCQRGQKGAGTTEQWEQATNWLVGALNRCQLPYEVDLNAKAFYGPRVEVRIFDALDQEWSGSFVEIDLHHAVKMGLQIQTAEGKKSAPVMINHAAFGSIERFIALLLEQCAGELPLWLAPEQLRVLPVGDETASYASEVAGLLQKEGLRVTVDYRNEALGAKIYSAEKAKVPYAIILGKDEQRKQLVTLRVCKKKQVLSGMTFSALMQRLQQELLLQKTVEIE